MPIEIRLHLPPAHTPQRPRMPVRVNARFLLVFTLRPGHDLNGPAPSLLKKSETPHDAPSDRAFACALSHGVHGPRRDACHRTRTNAHAHGGPRPSRR